MMNYSINWKIIPLGDIAEFHNGINFDKSSFGSGIKIIGVSDFQDFLYPDYSSLDEVNPKGIVHKEHLLEENDILFVRSNGNRQLIGRSLFLKNLREPLTHSAFTIRARFTSKATSPKFYFYLFRSSLIRDVLSNQGSGTNISNLNQDILSKLPVPLPTLVTQQKIAAILSAYDDLIENNTRRIKILEEMAQAMYREWFVNFRFPGHEGVRMVKSELGPVPEGWEVKKLGEVCLLIMGQSPNSEFYNETGEGLPFHQGVTNFGSRFPMDSVFCMMANRTAEEGDILFSVRAPVGRINLANKKIVIGRGLSAIRNKKGNQLFTYYQLLEHFKEEDSIGGGTIFKSVTKEDMSNIRLLIPDVNLIGFFEECIKPISAHIDNLIYQESNLRRTRDLLLPKLISGKIDVSDLNIEIPVPE